MTFGVMLPHFGREASRERLLEGAGAAERLGYDAVWVRDHLLWTPHRHEGADLTFLDATLTLAAVAGVTSRIMLGTAVLIPIRWPLKSAKELMTLDFLAGPGRVVAGVGAGHFEDEIRAVGLDPDRKVAIVEETIQLWREAFTRERVDFSGEMFSVEGAEMLPGGIFPSGTGGPLAPRCAGRPGGATDGFRGECRSPPSMIDSPICGRSRRRRDGRPRWWE